MLVVEGAIAGRAPLRSELLEVVPSTHTQHQPVWTSVSRYKVRSLC